jgi:hypothetical protein
MFNQNVTSDTKIAVLEERLSVYEQMVGRIDIAIQKISETNQGISKMLTIHNERIEQSIRTDDIIVKMIEDIKISSKIQHEAISEEIGERIEKLEKKVEHISQIKWMAVGCGVILAILTTAVSSLASGLWVPSGMQPNSINQNQSLTQFKINARI